MKKVFAVLLVLAVAAVLLLVKKGMVQSPSSASSSTNDVATAQAQQPIPPLPAGEGRGEGENKNQNGTVPADISSHAASPNSSSVANEVPALPPLTVLDNARVAVHNYCDAFGENPVGNNAEITAALMGKNPKGINFIRADAGLNVNANGELVDAYGTPFFFHQLSGTVMEIRSAGMDKKMWTFDDEVKL